MIPRSGTRVFKALAADKQQAVLQAALNEFALHGYRKASMNNVVKAAGISKGSLFQYFKTKQALFDGVVGLAEGLARSYLREMRDKTAGTPLRQRLERILQAGFVFIDQQPLLARIYFQLLHSGDAPFGSQRIVTLRGQAQEFLADLLRQGLEEKEIDPSVDVKRAAFLINSLFETLLRAYYTDFLAPGLGLYQGNAKDLDHWVETTLEMIFNGLRPNKQRASENP
ncbi:MAG: TetR/AcrR family transcriptional regulator [Thermodesulfobacteriota bacterium]